MQESGILGMLEKADWAVLVVLGMACGLVTGLAQVLGLVCVQALERVRAWVEKELVLEVLAPLP